MDTSGRVLLNDKYYRQLSRLSHGRYFAQLPNEKWILINTRGVQLSPYEFEKVVGADPYDGGSPYPFQEGVAVVSTNDLVGTIDTHGRFVLPLAPRAYYPDRADERYGDFIVEQVSNPSHQDEQTTPYLYGYWNLRTGRYVKPQYTALDAQALMWGVAAAQNAKDEMLLIDAGGNVLFRSQQAAQSPISANIDHMDRSYHFAYAAPDAAHERMEGGYAVSENAATPIGKAGSTRQINLRLYPNESRLLEGRYHAFNMTLMNETSDTVFFQAKDSRLYITIQAKNRNGKWRDIEYMPRSFCGNSYHTLNLQPGYGWTFPLVRYEGEDRTKMRAVLSQFSTDKYPRYAKRGLYSNEVEGFVNPGQFWRRMEHQRSGLMDPYLD